MDAERTREAIVSLTAEPVGAMLLGPERDGEGRQRVRVLEGLRPGVALDEVLAPDDGATGRWLHEHAALLVTCGEGRTVVFALRRREANRAMAELLASEFGRAGADALLARCSRPAARPARPKGGRRRRRGGRRA